MSRFLAVVLLLTLSACQFSPNAPQPTAAPLLPIQIIRFWEPANGALNTAGEIQPWDFIGQKGDAVRIGVVSQTTITLTLLSENGATIKQGMNQIEATLPDNGIYTIQAQANSPATYQLGLSYTDRPNPADATPTLLPVIVAVPTPTPPYYARLGTLIGTIQSGQTLTGTFDVPEERHVYSFNGSAGGYLTIQMSRMSGTVDPLLSLYAPSGSEVATDDNSGGDRAAVLRNIRLSEDGLYTIQAWGHGFAGGYQISLLNSQQALPVTPVFVRQSTPTPLPPIMTPTIGAAVNGQNLFDHTPVTGQIARAGDVTQYGVQGTAGQVITVAVSPTTGSKLKPHVELYDPDGQLVIAADANTQGDAVIPAQAITTTDTYVIFVSGMKTSTGGYQVSYGVGASDLDAPRGLTFADQTYNGGLSHQGFRDVWNLDLHQDDVITAAVNSRTPTFAPVLELIAPDGSTLALDANTSAGNEAQIASAHAPLSGRYRLTVAAAGANAIGTYTLVWHYINLSPTTTPMPGTVMLLSYDDSIPNQAYQFYPFYGQAGMNVLIQVVAQPGSSFDPVAALIAPDGSVIAQGDDSANDLNPRFTALLPADGTYTVRVNGYLTSGAFELTVQALYPPPTVNNS